MRVISGKFRGSKLSSPPLEITRATTDRVKEAIFSKIQFEVKNSIFLDLFAGSGSLSIEAVSRGAMKSILVEKNQKSISVIQENLKKLNISNYKLVKSDVILFLQRQRNVEFDFIFLDPPYDDLLLANESLKLISENKILKKYGLIIFKHNTTNVAIPKGLVIQSQKKYGNANIFFISNNI